jgi:hypothetical protein
MRSGLSNAITFLSLILGMALPLATSAAVWAPGRVAEPTAPDVSIPSESPARTGSISIGFAVADFTGDTHPDLATVALNGFDSTHARYGIEVQLSEGGRQLLSVTAPFGGILITPKDVTGDGNLDLVIRSARSQAPIAVFLNNGHGHFFAAETSSFADLLREGTSEYEFGANHFYFIASAVSPKSYAVHGATRTSRPLQKRNSPLFLANGGSPSHLFLPSGLNRAPPAVA